MENADVATAIQDISVVYDRKFTQIGSSALIIDGTTAGNGSNGAPVGTTIYSSGDCFLHCIGMKVLEIKSNMRGYEISDKAMTQIAGIIDESPLIYPSQQLQYYAFPSTPNENGLQTSVNPPLKNVVACVVAFPRRALDLTVFENPIYKGLQLRLNQVNYPNEQINSLGARFLQYELTANELDGFLEATQEFEDSYTQERNAENGTRYANTLRDATSFLFNVETERSGAGYCFDGLDSKGQNVNIELVGMPIHTGVNDTYYNCGPASNPTAIHPVAPQLWICKDTFFIVNRRGMWYKLDETPRGTQTDAENY
jgi:hypothetical protein